MLGRAGLGVRLCGLLAQVALITLARTSRAGPAAQTFSLAYDVPARCPARGTFVASIVARAPGSRESPDAAELAFDVRVSEVGELTRGVLSVRFIHGEHFEREVPPAPCADVTTSMAIMAGLLLSGALVPEAAREEPPVVPATVLEPPASPASPAGSAEPTVAPPPVETARPPTSATASPQHVTLGRVRLAAFAHGALDLGGLPFPAFGVNAGLDLALERPSLLAPSLRAGFSYRASRATSPLGDGLFVLRALMLRGCPLRVPLAAALVFRPCALVDAGLLNVSGRSTTHPAERSMTWLALGGAGRLEARLGALFALEAELSVYGLVHHDRFVLDPGAVELHDIPPVSGGASVGFSARLP